MDTSQVQAIRADMERAQARRLQPHFISSFFLEAFRLLGGKIHRREGRRYEITFVPQAIRSRDRQIGRGEAVLDKYERVTFEKDLSWTSQNQTGKQSVTLKYGIAYSNLPRTDQLLTLLL
jgi:hypothetical protein